jgi:hypothetical protein
MLWSRCPWCRWYTTVTLLGTVNTAHGDYPYVSEVAHEDVLGPASTSACYAFCNIRLTVQS